MKQGLKKNLLFKSSYSKIYKARKRKAKENINSKYDYI
jgi:hypothetical protein